MPNDTFAEEGPFSGNIFHEVHVYPNYPTGSVVQWSLLDGMTDSGPWAWTLQASHSGNPAADDWVTAVTGVDDINTLTDPGQRAWSFTERTFYRVKLQTAAGVYYSLPALSDGALTGQDRLYYREIVRAERLRIRKGAGVTGALLKRKWWGVRCQNPGCIDPDTQEVRNPRCPVCFGTGWQGGYFPAIAYEMEIDNDVTQLSQSAKAGTSNTGTGPTSRSLAAPALRTMDVFVDTNTGKRWKLSPVAVAAAIRHVPLILQVKIEPVGPNDVIYAVPIS
jgi:hypothetical protein